MMANSMIGTKCGKWAHGRCAKMKRVTSTLAKGFVFKLVLIQSWDGGTVEPGTMEGMMEPGEQISLFDQVNFVKSFCYLGSG